MQLQTKSESIAESTLVKMMLNHTYRKVHKAVALGAII